MCSVDDFLGPDLRTGEDTAMLVLQGIVHMLGKGHERPSHLKLQSPEMDPGRTRPPRPSNTALGGRG